MPAPADPCMFCGEYHKGECGGAKKKAVVRPTRRLTTAAPPDTSPQPSKLDRIKAAASEDWKPTVESIPRRRPVSMIESAIKAERNYTEALDPETVAINGAVRALHTAGLLGEKQQAEWSAVLATSPSLEEEKLLWRMQHKAAKDTRPASP